MSRLLRRLAAAGLLLPALILASPASAGEGGFDAAAFDASLAYRSGDVPLPGGKAVLHLGTRFRYLSPEDTQRLLEQAWGNPDGSGTLGMIVPASQSPVQDGGWGVVVQYDDSGHVADDDAREINYDELLADMKTDAQEANAERAKAGYEPVELVGWAARPYYDAGGKRLHWAKELKFGQAGGNTLNYNVRVLGREGVLVLNAVAGMDQLASLKPELEAVVGVPEFTDGHRYADYNAATDRASEYGLAALVAGGVAAKAGWFAPLLLFLKKGFVLVLLAFGWLGKKVLGLLGRKE